MKGYWIKVYGCQMNERDGEIIAGLLEDAGYFKAPAMEEADIVILHTCCVREKAENKVYGRLGQLARLKSKKPDLIIAVGGCMTQQPGAAEKMREKAPHVDLIYGTHNLHELPELLKKVEQERRPVAVVWEKEGPVVEGLPLRRTHKAKALVTISYGCNNFCTYCIVPYVRGRERSRRPEDIIKEIKALVADGVLEVMLLGQNVNSYGKDLEDGIDFGWLLERVNAIQGLKRIRYMTSHPRDFTFKLVETISRLDKVCEHVHLPVQAGSNRVLELMNRGYTREHYLELVEVLRRHIPGVSITTDLIVGFPGETEEDFQDTLSLVEQVQFDNAFTFMFSPRKGTVAASLPEQVPLEVKKERLYRLMEVQNRISRAKNEALVGQEMEVLVDGPSETDPKNLSGRTRTNKLVIFPGPEELTGKLVKVKITQAQTFLLKGEVVS
ncbi:MAG: tRNA (N6-isopentenyl adenosine(37)-C2)-methylthiotransferase MiaB [Thermanaeromonas sp.]|uniref:tRNA (N6-isopentenyl adenosine(37)-C2)-methylthiotransferase MiaB n=1 Tax=Thermanaeromonas sp. TaxID=2003697 RepID=UPI00243BB012|nr:tRNA (N6-isopentenyl adenosine(37)-C2)-methylthiotransferase MiaB [Thermanaeromonas sp.]MCG0277812.1 tRNA (N6-isopentenyl adenosine(37)-C2)-methylthiotransferase MiaB [Thermanaeromonas sp.]